MVRVCILCVVKVALLSILGCEGNIKQNVIVHTTYGPVEGFSIPSQYALYPWNYRRINCFLGIPYAKRPEQWAAENKDWRREFRFRKPNLPSWSSMWQATAYKPACPQHLWLVRETVPRFSKKDTNEDCLYLNIFAPNQTDEINSHNPTLYPVLVFIHGGGYTMGASQQYPGVFLAEQKIVVVTFNYRLNALGFLSTEDKESPGNYGMWDQVRVLEFVRDNIRFFRGDPRLVTLAGQSTGAASVGLHLLSPRSVHLFSQAIMMSGSDRSQWAYIPPTHAKDYAKALAMEVGCPAEDNWRLIECLQLRRTVDEIVNASAKVRLKEGGVGNPWGPVVDGPIEGVNYGFLPDTPKNMREQGRFMKIRVMLGLNKDDGSFFIPNLPSLEEGLSPTQFNNIIREFLEDRQVMDMTNAMDALGFEYTNWAQPRNYSAVRQQLSDMMTDYMFGTGVDEVAKHHVQYNKTFFYSFHYRSWNDYLPPWRGVAHGQELQYVFGFPYINETYVDLFGVYPRQEYDWNDGNITEYMTSMWANFTANGNPTPPVVYDKKYFRNCTWMEYNPQNHSYVSIGNRSFNMYNYRQQEFGFWKEYFPKIAIRYQIHTTSSPLEETPTEYAMATYSLSALAALLFILLIALSIVMCRMRPKDY